MRVLLLGVMAAALLSATAVAREPGDRVIAKWSFDGLWYPARVTDVAGREVTVKYDDGKVAIMDAADVRALDWRAGSRLQCNWKNLGPYYRGVVLDIEGEVITFRYDDGYKETLPVSRCRWTRAEK